MELKADKDIHAVKPKIFLLSTIPAPYRISVFSGLSKEYDITCFFETTKNESRNSEWFEKSGRFKFQLLNTVEGVKKYKECIKNLKSYDLVLIYEYSTLTAIKLQLTCIWCKVPYMINCDGATVINMGFPKKQIKTFLVSNAAKCLAGCKKAKEYLLTYGAKEENVDIHNFTSLYEKDILKERPNEGIKSNIRVGLELPLNKTIVLAVGQFIHRKGFDVLIKAWGKANTDSAILVILGGGPEKDRYIRLIQELQLDNIMLIDFVKPNDVLKYMQAADLFVLPTRTDIWGLVINEAMANALPVITTTECTAGVELVENGINGYLVKVDDINGLADRINVTIKDSTWLKMAGEKSLEKIRPFTFESIIEAHKNTINRYLNL